MHIPKYEWFQIQFNKAEGYIVVWQKRIVAVFKTLQAAKVWVRKAQALMRYMQRAKELFQPAMGDAFNEFLAASSNVNGGFIPLFPVVNT